MTDFITGPSYEIALAMSIALAMLAMAATAVILALIFKRK